MMRLCLLCGVRPAELPDRDRPGRPIKRICRECHAERLRADMEKILATHDRRHATLDDVMTTLDQIIMENRQHMLARLAAFDRDEHPVAWEIRSEGGFLALRYTREAAERAQAEFTNRWDRVTIHEIARG